MAAPIIDHAAPWERQPNETAKAFAHFVVYRDLPDRNVRKAWRAIGTKALTRIQLEAKQHQWEERARAWDNEQDRIARSAGQKKREEMARRHATIAQNTLAVLMEPVRELAKRMSNKTLNLGKLSDVELLRMVEKSARAIEVLVEVEQAATGAIAMAGAKPDDGRALDVMARDVAVTAMTRALASGSPGDLATAQRALEGAAKVREMD